MDKKQLQERKKELETQAAEVQQKHQLAQAAIVQTQNDLMKLQGAYEEVVALLGKKEPEVIRKVKGD